MSNQILPENRKLESDGLSKERLSPEEFKKSLEIIPENPNFIIKTKSPWVNEKFTEDQFENLKYTPNKWSQLIEKGLQLKSQLFQNPKSLHLLKLLLLFLACLGFFIWFLICNSRKKTLFSMEPNIRYFCITIVVLLYFLWIFYKLRYTFNYDYKKYTDVITSWEYGSLLRSIIFIILYILIFIYIIYMATRNGLKNLIPLAGISANLIFGFLISFAPNKINFRPVVSGILIQFIFALLVLRTTAGAETFNYFSEMMKAFLSNVDQGATFLFGDYSKHFFAFRILPVLAYIYCITYVLYYFKILQNVILIVSTIMEVIMGTTAGESMSAAANIFIGMIEAPLLIKPFLSIMTNSELFAVMTGGFATIAGTVLSAFIMFGIPANHLLTASIMGAPGALAISKLVYPETKVSITTSADVRRIPDSTYHNVIEAITESAIDSASLIACVALNLLVFICLLSFVNSVLKWIGNSMCMTHVLSFEFICSYLFWPIAFLIGIDYRDCFKVAELFGIKIFLNEFIAYQKLGVIIGNKKIYDAVNWSITTVYEDGDDLVLNGVNKTILKNGILFSDRSVVITTYILCGFGNIASVGMLLGVLINIAPHRSKDISSIIPKALVAGNMVSLLTGCIAGLLYEEKK